VTATWRVAYYSQTVASTVVATDSLVSTARSYMLMGLENYRWYTVTLDAVVDTTSVLTDSVCAMPTDVFVHLPLIQRAY
jgi:hypothetical protein